ncbi:MAG: hypothetical protein GVY35_13365 [Bacteroidetes bacterium]|jgi:hypothetical protein|nr:hypothetical protein [Bacteroidota bacterium]
MRKRLLITNHALLFLCTAMYLGTGWSLVLFSFPVAPELTVDTYYMQFVPQVTAATEFFTVMTNVMLVTALVMVWAEWRTAYRWAPITVLLGVVAATALTLLFIFPYNEAMREGITDPAVLDDTLSRWMRLNVIRVSIWTVEWAAMMVYFAAKVYYGHPMGLGATHNITTEVTT